MGLSYKKINLPSFLKDYQGNIADSAFFELTPIWLGATAEYVLPEQSLVQIHCLFELSDNHQEKLLIAWPLVHESTSKNQTIIRSLTSFYSAVTAPFLMTDSASTKKIDDGKVQTQLLTLLTYIKKNNAWQQMLLGPLADDLSQLVSSHFSYAKTYAQADNWYHDNIADFNSYYQQRPSKLKNTIKRKQKKLTKASNYHTHIVSTEVEFLQFFPAYQAIYQASWKGDEYSFAFIKQVCLQAIQYNKLRMGLLFIEDKPVAMQLWFVQCQTASIFKLAYDPQYQQYSVGSILSMALSEHVIEQDEVSCIEFGMGGEAYKQDWMNEKRQRVTLQVFNERSLLGTLLAVRYMLPAKIKTLLSRKNKG